MITVKVLKERPYTVIVCSILTVYGIKYLREISNQLCCLKMFWTYSFGASADSQNQWSCWSISPKTVLIFLMNFLDVRFAKVEKQSIMNLSCSNINSCTSVVHVIPLPLFSGKIKMQPFIFFSVFCLKKALLDLYIFLNKLTNHNSTKDNSLNSKIIMFGIWSCEIGDKTKYPITLFHRYIYIYTSVYQQKL